MAEKPSLVYLAVSQIDQGLVLGLVQLAIVAFNTYYPENRYPNYLYYPLVSLH